MPRRCQFVPPAASGLPGRNKAAEACWQKQPEKRIIEKDESKRWFPRQGAEMARRASHDHEGGTVIRPA